MNIKGTYRSIKKTSEGYYKEKGSKFMAFSFPVSTEEEIKSILGRLKKKYHDARHHCYAWKIGIEEPYSRANDDGEPSGTAGKPILGRITSYELTNILIVVIRYFGGTLLGTSGLIRSYRTAAESALESAKIVTTTITKPIVLRFPYSKMNEVMRLLKDHSLKPIHQASDEWCILHFNLPLNIMHELSSKFSSIDSLTMEEKT